MEFDRFALADAEGAVLAHSVKAGDVVLRKGRLLSSHDWRGCAGRRRDGGRRPHRRPTTWPRTGPRRELPHWRRRLDRGRRRAFTGRANLHASARGLLVVDRERVDRFNRIDEAVTLATLPEHAVVDPRQMVATVKIIPFAIPAALLERCRRRWPTVRCCGWRRSAPGAPRLIQTELPSVAAKVLDKTVRVTRDRVAAVARRARGRDPLRARPPPPWPRPSARPMAAGCDMLLIAGASAITDRHDVLPAGIEAAGGSARAFRHAGRSRQPAAAGAAATAGRCWACRAAAARPSSTASTGCCSGWRPASRSPAATSCAWAWAGC